MTDQNNSKSQRATLVAEIHPPACKLPCLVDISPFKTLSVLFETKYFSVMIYADTAFQAV